MTDRNPELEDDISKLMAKWHGRVSLAIVSCHGNKSYGQLNLEGTAEGPYLLGCLAHMLVTLYTREGAPKLLLNTLTDTGNFYQQLAGTVPNAGRSERTDH